ncbi:MAG TPA: hypothetical protein VF789_04380 [Thermoanaerobaculia bacterium]
MSEVIAETTIGKVDFKAGDPCRPRYLDLYEDQGILADPRTQVEPSLQVGSSVSELQVRMELADGADGKVEFTDEDGRPLCRELNDPESRPQIEYDGPSACVLTWSRGSADLATRVFRIYCQRRDKDLTDEERVYGGIFVAVTTSMSVMKSHIPHEHPGPVELRRVVVIGTDPHGRPVYDVFKKHQITQPLHVELAPSFRVREGKSLEFSMVMGIEYACWNGQVQYIQPKGEQPPHLQKNYDPQDPKKYHFHWQTPSRECTPKDPFDCYRGEIVTFHLEPRLEPIASDVVLPESLRRAGFQGWDDYDSALRKINVDPTIIQPPPCDPVYRVCAA